MSTAAAIAACRDATAHLGRGDVAAAAALIEPLLAAAPTDPNLLYVAGNVALAGGDEERALPLYERAVAAAADFPAALLNLGFLLRRQHRLAEARSVLRMCASLTPGDPTVWLNLSATFVNEGEPAAGEAVAREGLRHCPESPDVRWNLGLLLLEQGRWREGWPEYFQRFDTLVLEAPHYGPGRIRPPRLTVLDDLQPGQLIICHGEQGLGDEILFAGMLAEFLAAARDRGAEVVLDCNSRLRSVFARNFAVPLMGDGSPAARAEFDRPIDWVLPIGDLGRFFRNEDRDFPDQRGYLSADPARVAEVRDALARVARGRPLVGLAWTGGTARTHDRYRQVPLEQWLPLLRQDACFVSLEYRDRAAEIAAFRQQHGIEVVSFPEFTQADDYARTFELVAALDLVVTVPTSVLHVAGAVGVPCLVAMHHRAAWRECSRGGRMPWYPQTHELFVREAENPDWEGVIGRLKDRFLSVFSHL
jgi:Tfp pilus assembly protein PilF